MANTLALVSNKGIGFFRSPGIVRVDVTIGATYTTATGGLPIDIASILTAAGPNPTNALLFADLVDVWGRSTLGHQVVTFAKSTGTTITVKLFSGATEASDGAMSTGVLQLFLMFG